MQLATTYRPRNAKCSKYKSHKNTKHQKTRKTLKTYGRHKILCKNAFILGTSFVCFGERWAACGVGA